MIGLAAFVLFLLAGPAFAHNPPSWPQRIIPTGDVTFYVAPLTDCINGYWPSEGAVTVCGSDATGDGSKSAPFATPQKAHDLFAEKYDFQCKFKPTIQLAVGNAPAQFVYPGIQISGRLVGQCGTLAPLYVATYRPPYLIGKYIPYTLRGDPANMTGAFINPGDHGFPSVPCISLTDGAALKVEGLTCDTTNAQMDGFDIFTNSFMDMSYVWFGNAGYPNGTSSNIHIGVAFSSALIVTGPYWVTGSAWAHINLGQFSSMYFDNNGDAASPIQVNVYPGISFPASWYMIDAGHMFAVSVHYSNTAVNGPKYIVVRQGVIETGGTGCELIPGNAPGQIQSGGVCH